MVEQLSVKQCVVGSSPTILSFGSSICLDSLLAVRSTGLKNRRVVVRLHFQAPHSRVGDYLLKKPYRQDLQRGTTSYKKIRCLVLSVFGFS